MINRTLKIATEEVKKFGWTFTETEWKGVEKKYHFICPLCNEPWLVVYASFIRQNVTSCPKCKNDKLKKYKETAKSHGWRILDEVWSGNKTNYNFVCSENHRPWNVRIDTFLKFIDKGCPICRETHIYHTIEECQELAIKYNAECLSEVYPEFREPLEWLCKRCEQTWKARLDTIQRSIGFGSFCPWCDGGGRNKIELTIEDCHQEATKHEGRCLSTEYVNSNTKMLWKCKNPNHDPWEATFSSIRNRETWCANCITHHSDAELELYQFIQKSYPDAQSGVRVFKNKLFEADIFVPSLKKIVEYDGTYWHSDPKAIERDARKNQDAVESGYQLLRIKEKDYTENPTQIQQQVLSWLLT